jgi:hypothetical protein
MSTTLDRVPTGLSELLGQKAKQLGTSKTDLYRQIEMAMRGVDSIEKILKDCRRKNEKPPFSF